MSSINIIGGKPLLGEIEIQGSKNAALPILAGTILHQGVTRLEGCPKISDVLHMSEILEELGCVVTWEKKTLIVDATTLSKHAVVGEVAKKTRASVLFLGALLGREKTAVVSYPGGCSIGERPIDLHLAALRKLGVSIKEDLDLLYCNVAQMTGSKIHFSFPSVGATENIILASVLAEGETNLYNAAREPEIVALCEFLVAAGANISGIGTSHLKIEGVQELKEVTYKIPADRIVAGTYLTAVAGAGGSAVLHGVREKEIRMVVKMLRKAGCSVDFSGEHCLIRREKRLKSVSKIETKPFPGFPTDMQSQFMAILSTAMGESKIVENIFEARFLVADELVKMGANIEIRQDTSTAIIYGVKQLHGTPVVGKDLRGAAALVIAGLMADGVTTVSGMEYVMRGYEDICSDLISLGANVTESVCRIAK
ncbi:MAG: UDP-N-acetylglucosamine 1-carboxyvinyltransferase [Lachnospiraceae bacterium]|nr:UDP-N-acetylglucosamine 1-carboxyvinyltransferase [Lachnospiraceae bacterium]